MDFLLYAASLEASVATRSKMSDKYVSVKDGNGNRIRIPLTKEFKMDIARLEIPVSGWTCLRTNIGKVLARPAHKTRLEANRQKLKSV